MLLTGHNDDQSTGSWKLLMLPSHSAFVVSSRVMGSFVCIDHVPKKILKNESAMASEKLLIPSHFVLTVTLWDER